MVLCVGAGGGFPSPEIPCVSAKKSAGELEISLLSRERGSCHRTATFARWKHPQVQEHFRESIPLNMINACTSASYFHPIIYFLHV